MVLSDLEIRMEIGSGRLKFTPEIEWDQITPSSVDLRLGNTFTTFRPSPEGVATLIDLVKVGNVEEIVEAYGDTKTLIEGETFRLEPGQFVLAFPSPSFPTPIGNPGGVGRVFWFPASAGMVQRKASFIDTPASRYEAGS